MNTKVKVGIASAIVAALVALIVLDQKTTPKDDAAKPGSGGDATTIVGTNGSADPAATRVRDDEINSVLREAQQRFGTVQPRAAENNNKAIKGSEEKNEKKIPSPTGEEYVIKTGDTVDSIAKAHYGNSSFAAMILEGNPGLKANALRVGKRIVLPPKAEPAVAKDPVPATTEEKPLPPPPPPTGKKPDAALATVDGKKIYTVQTGDVLSSISSKVYGTSRYYKQIYEANKDQIDDPNTIPVGMKLVMPDLPSKTNGSAAGTVATTSPAPTPVPAGAKTVQVSEGQSLWKIAEKFAVERKIGVHDMIKLIVAANPDKLKDEGSLLRLGWQLIIPE